MTSITNEKDALDMSVTGRFVTLVAVVANEHDPSESPEAAVRTTLAAVADGVVANEHYLSEADEAAMRTLLAWVDAFEVEVHRALARAGNDEHARKQIETIRAEFLADMVLNASQEVGLWIPRSWLRGAPRRDVGGGVIVFVKAGVGHAAAERLRGVFPFPVKVMEVARRTASPARRTPST